MQDMSLSSEELMRVYLVDVVQQGKLELIDTLALPDMVDEANQAFGGPPGRDGLVAHVKGFRRHIEQPEVLIRRIVGNEQEVMAWWSFQGIHAGPWLGVEPSGKEISATVFSFFALQRGRIARYRLWLQASLEPPVTFDSQVGLASRAAR